MRSDGLAERVLADLARRGMPGVPLEALVRLLDIAFFGSMRTEESRALIATLAFVDPANPDPARPNRVRPNRWSIIPFAEPVPLTVNSLAKLAQAAPPYASSIAVFAGAAGQPYAWGLIDQALHDFNSLNHEAKRKYARPGRFQIDIAGVGEISVFDDVRLIATLRRNEIVGEPIDVLARGPVQQHLARYVARHEEVLRQGGIEPDRYGRLVHDGFISTLCRILTGIRRLRHGGAVLLLPDPAPADALADLQCKFRIKYDKLVESISRCAETQFQHFCADQDIDEFVEEHDAGDGRVHIPYSAHLAEANGRHARDDWFEAQDGAINFIAALSRIDGLVLLKGGLEVAGFGVEILTRRDPEALFVAADAEAAESKRNELAIDQYGTRHRSMMRYCFAHPSALGFVVSQDGDVRALTRVGAQLVLWENVHLHNRALTPRISVGGYGRERDGGESA